MKRKTDTRTHKRAVIETQKRETIKMWIWIRIRTVQRSAVHIYIRTYIHSNN